MKEADIKELLESLGENTPFLSQISHTLLLTQEIYNSHKSLVDSFKHSFEEINSIKDSLLVANDAIKEEKGSVEILLGKTKEDIQTAQNKLEFLSVEYQKNLQLLLQIKEINAQIESKQTNINAIERLVLERYNAIKDINIDANDILKALKELENQKQQIEDNVLFFKAEKQKIIQEFYREVNISTNKLTDKSQEAIKELDKSTEQIAAKLRETVKKANLSLETFEDRLAVVFKDLSRFRFEIKDIQVHCTLEFMRDAINIVNHMDSAIYSAINQYKNAYVIDVYNYFTNLKAQWSSDFIQAKEHLQSVLQQSNLNLQNLETNRKDMMFLSFLKRSN